jgi:TolA-binding protein
MINRDNYEEYFLLYTDNELSDAERIAVEEFIKENPDLRGELIMMQQLKLKPEQNIFFGDKNMLFRESGGSPTINHNNYEEYFLLYADNELNADEKKKVEKFVINNPALRQEFELLLITQVGPDNNIVFPNKGILYRKSERRIVFLPWVRIAAAAAVLLLVGLFVFNNIGKNSLQPIGNVNDNKKSDTNNIAENKKEIKKIEPTVTSPSTDSLNMTNTASKKLAVNNEIKKMSGKKNKNIETKQNQQQSKQDVALQTVDSSEQIIAAAKIEKPVQKVNEAKKSEITAPSITSNTASVVAFASTNNIDDVSNNTGDDKGDLYADNTSTKKNKFRGFFRKVSRAFNKTAHVDNENNDAILIGSFRIALK